MSTFKIKTGLKETDARDVEILEEFELFGETWIVHVPLEGEGFRVSHKETGFGVPGSGAETKEGARKKAELKLASVRGQIPGVIAKARAMFDGR